MKSIERKKPYSTSGKLASIATEVFVLTPVSDVMRRRRRSKIRLGEDVYLGSTVAEGLGIALMYSGREAMGATIYTLGKIAESGKVLYEKLPNFLKK